MTGDAAFTRRLRDRCNVPRLFASLDLADMQRDDPAYGAILDRLMEMGTALAAGTSPPVFVLLTGPFGTGKTRAACWLLAQAYRGILFGAAAPTWTREQPLYLKAARLVEYRFRGQYADAEGVDAWEARRAQIFRSRFLVIDDIGRLSGYKGEEAFVERVVEERWEAELSTVLTGNARAEDLGPRFADFINYFEEFTMASKSRRGAA